MTTVLVPSSAPLAVLASRGVVTLLVSEKRVEPGRALIATSDTEPIWDEKFGEWVVSSEPGGKWVIGNYGGDVHWPVPLGRVVASCTIECVPIVTEAGCTEVPGKGPMITVSRDGKCVTWFEWANTVSPSRYSDKDVTDGWLKEQLAYQDFPPGSFALLLGDVKPVEERCPECWREAPVQPVVDLMHKLEDALNIACERCKGSGRCDPYPASDDERSTQ